jgi:hypothetical protein
MNSDWPTFANIARPSGQRRFARVSIPILPASSEIRRRHGSWRPPTTQVPQGTGGYQRSVGAHCKTHAGNENSVEEALQDRRETLVPNWINEDQPFRRHKPIGVGGDVRAIELQVMGLSNGSKRSA